MVAKAIVIFLLIGISQISWVVDEGGQLGGTGRTRVEEDFSHMIFPFSGRLTPGRALLIFFNIQVHEYVPYPRLSGKWYLQIKLIEYPKKPPRVAINEFSQLPNPYRDENRATNEVCKLKKLKNRHVEFTLAIVKIKAFVSEKNPFYVAFAACYLTKTLSIGHRANLL